MFQSLAWTAHGTKIWDRDGSLSYTIRDAAMPELEDIVSELELSRLVDKLDQIDIHQYDSSITVRRDVRRVPLKVSSLAKMNSSINFEVIMVLVFFAHTTSIPRILRVGMVCWKLLREFKR